MALMARKHFDTAPGYPQSRKEVDGADDQTLVDFMGVCAIEPADFANCLACYAYKVVCDREDSK